MAVDIEDGGILDRTIDQIPGVRSSSLSTQAVVRQDESLLIGGYNTEHRIASRDQVPLLGDVPLVGLLFSSRSTDVQRRERLFLIRPKIIELPTGEELPMGEELPEPHFAPVREINLQLRAVEEKARLLAVGEAESGR